MAGGETIGYHTWKAGTTSTNYLHRDYQGSVRDVSGPTGAGGREETAYDAWGKRRNPVTYASYNAGTYPLTTALETAEGMRRGYTGHEHLDQLGLINMNGRVYDPEIGQFLSADPFVQFPESTQGYNRYAYVNNNPMSYSDPSGYEIFSLIAAARIANVQTVATVYWYEQMAIMAVAGYMDSGSLKGAATSAASAGLSNAIGGLGESGFFGSGAWEIARRSVAHGIVQGGLADAGGGRFGDGFLGGMAGGLSEYLDIPDGALGTVVVATVGGTVSTIGGGKLGNGAASAAFVHVFNHLGHASWQLSTDDRPMDGVFAVDAGKVLEVGWENPLKHHGDGAGAGYRIKLLVNDGKPETEVIDIYGHLDKESIRVKRGDAVVANQYLARYASPTNGRSNGPHVHYMRFLNGALQNPGSRSPVPNGLLRSGFKATDSMHKYPHSGTDWIANWQNPPNRCSVCN